jgi:hypothetical protein
VRSGSRQKKNWQFRLPAGERTPPCSNPILKLGDQLVNLALVEHRLVVRHRRVSTL